ncbi:hypothetical protein ACJX0J_038799, partial [Zea mays]
LLNEARRFTLHPCASESYKKLMFSRFHFLLSEKFGANLLQEKKNSHISCILI